MFRLVRIPRIVTGANCDHTRVRLKDRPCDVIQRGILFYVFVNRDSPRTLRGCIQNELYESASEEELCLLCGMELMPGHRFYKIRTLPEVLIIVIRRYEEHAVPQPGEDYNYEPPAPSHAACEVPEILDLGEFRENEDRSRDQSAVYQYAAAVFHQGATLQSGHYVTHVRNKDGRYFLLDDKAHPRVRETSFQAIHNDSSWDVTIVAYVKSHEKTAGDDLDPNAEERVLAWWRNSVWQATPDQNHLSPVYPESGASKAESSKAEPSKADSSEQVPNTKTPPDQDPSEISSDNKTTPDWDSEYKTIAEQIPAEQTLPTQSPADQIPPDQELPNQTPNDRASEPEYINMDVAGLRDLMKSVGIALDSKKHPIEWYINKLDGHYANRMTYKDYTFVALKKEILQRGLDPKGLKTKDAAVREVQKDDKAKGYKDPSIGFIKQDEKPGGKPEISAGSTGTKKTAGSSRSLRSRKEPTKAGGNKDHTSGKLDRKEDDSTSEQADEGAATTNPVVGPPVPPTTDLESYSIRATLQIMGKTSGERADPLVHTWALPADFRPDLNVNVGGMLTITAPEGQKSQYPLPASDRQIFHIPSLISKNKKRKTTSDSGDGGDGGDDDDEDEDNSHPPKRPASKSPPLSQRSGRSPKPPKKPKNPQQSPSKGGHGSGSCKKDARSVKDSSSRRTPDRAPPSPPETPASNLAAQREKQTTLTNPPLTGATRPQSTQPSSAETDLSSNVPSDLWPTSFEMANLPRVSKGPKTSPSDLSSNVSSVVYPTLSELEAIRNRPGESQRMPKSRPAAHSSRSGASAGGGRVETPQKRLAPQMPPTPRSPTARSKSEIMARVRKSLPVPASSTGATSRKFRSL